MRTRPFTHITPLTDRELVSQIRLEFCPGWQTRHVNIESEIVGRRRTTWLRFGRCESRRIRIDESRRGDVVQLVRNHQKEATLVQLEFASKCLLALWGKDI